MIASEQQLLADIQTILPKAVHAILFAPHPDDEVFGCGGTLQLLQQQGAQITTIIVTDGAAGGENADGELSSIRKAESVAAAHLLGLPDPVFWDLPDRGLAYGEPLIERLAAVILDSRADLALLPSPTEVHPDHQSLALAGLEAVRRAGNRLKVACYEINRPLPDPNLIIDITLVADKKKAAAECFASQLAEQPYYQRIEGLNRSRSYFLGPQASHAEAFLLTDADSIAFGLRHLFDGPLAHRRRLGFAADSSDLPLVSIIIRSMDRVTLPRALDSLALQSWPNAEVVLVNAKGGDHAAYGSSCGRFPFRLLNQGGRPLTRPQAANAGLAACQGKYIGFLDDDDSLTPEHLQCLVAALQASAGARMAYSCVRGVAADHPHAEAIARFCTPEVSFARLLFGNIIPIHSVLFESSLLEQGARFDEGLELYEDWDFWLQLTRQTRPVFVDKVTAIYHADGNSSVGLGTEANEGLKQALKKQVTQKWLPLLAPDEFVAIGDLYHQTTQQLAVTDVELAQQKGALELLTGQMQRQEQQLAEQEQQLAELKRQLAEKDQQLAEQEQQQAELKRQLAEQERQLAEQGQQLAEQEQQLAERGEQLNELHRQHILQGEQLAARNLQLDRLYSSRSWQVTAPLRWGADRFRCSPLAEPLRRLRHLLGRVGSNGLQGLQQQLSEKQQQLSQQQDYAAWIAGHDTITDEKRALLQGELQSFANRPLISVLLPCYNPEPCWLVEAINSVRQQLYPHWELCIADDASTNPAIRPLLEQIAAEEPRIRLCFRSQNGHISAASNSALQLATGEYVALLDHDDLLSEDALFRMVEGIQSCPEADLLYSDEDQLDTDGSRCQPFFKPDWSPHLAISQAYLGHLVMLRRTVLNQVGGFRPGLDGAQDYDLWLRCSLLSRKILHIPHLLYHWRRHAASTAANSAAKPYAHEAGRQAVEHYLQQRYPDKNPKVVDGAWLFTYQPRFKIDNNLKVSIIIPTRDGLQLLKPCIESILERSTWQNFEIIILDNGSVEPETVQYLAGLSDFDKRIKVIQADILFNWSRLNNIGAAEASGNLLLFLNNDTVVITPDWLERLTGYATLPDVALVGGLLLFEDGTIQHSGVVVGMGGWADHIYRGCQARHAFSPFVSPMLTRNVLAVTGACLAITRERFDELGGFDESFIICGSDVELGLRGYKKGYFNLICAEAQLYHLESKTRTPFIPEEDFVQSAVKYEPYRTEKVDPFYNRNLSLSETSPALG